MAKFEMGDMPEAPESDELEIEGAEYEAPEDKPSSVSGLVDQLPDMSDEELDELESAISEERSSREGGDEDMDMEPSEETEESMDELFA